MNGSGIRWTPYDLFVYFWSIEILSKLFIAKTYLLYSMKIATMTMMNAERKDRSEWGRESRFEEQRSIVTTNKVKFAQKYVKAGGALCMRGLGAEQEEQDETERMSGNKRRLPTKNRYKSHLQEKNQIDSVVATRRMKWKGWSK